MEQIANSIHPKSRAAWRRWLQLHHIRAEGVWLITYKKSTGKPPVKYIDAVEEALCFGWIDSKPRALDEERSMLWFAPRKPRTGWSKHNKARVKKLIQSGLRTPAGLAKIQAAKKDSSWTALDQVEASELPSDLADAFAINSTAQEYFMPFPVQ